MTPSHLEPRLRELVFVNIYTDGALSLDLLLTRVPGLGEEIIVEARTYKIVRVQHQPVNSSGRTSVGCHTFKTMAGEKLQRVRIGPLGHEGDRVVHVEDSKGQVITSRSHPRFLGHKGTLGEDGEPQVDGRSWRSPEVAADVVEIAGPGAKLVRDDSPERFDVLPLLVATDGAIAAFGHDGRRLRPNVVIGGVEGMSEREWPGGRLKIGKVLIGV